MTYDLARIEAAVRAVAPEAKIRRAHAGHITVASTGGSTILIEMASTGAYSVGYSAKREDRAIVRAVLDELDAQDAARGA